MKRRVIIEMKGEGARSETKKKTVMIVNENEVKEGIGI
jgi:hypothetical protein